MTDADVTILDGVELGEGVVLRPPCVVGEPARGQLAGQLATRIGAGSVIRSFTVVYAGAVLGARVQTGHGALIREGNVVGDDTSIGSHSVLEGLCTIGERVRIHSNCFLESVTLGDDVFVGPGVIFTDDPHPPCPKYVECGQGVVVESGAKIGGGAVLLPGVTVGARALVGGGSVVTKDVPAHAVVVGNPARVVKTIEELDCFAGLYSRVFEWEDGERAMPEAVPAVKLDNEAVWEAILPRLKETVLAGRFILSDEVDEFEEAAARFFSCDWAVGTSSGTSALTLALRAAGLKPRSRVGLPANTFFATFEAIVSAGHTPVVLDVGDDYLIGPQELEGHTLDALVPVHLFGLPADMPALMELASKNGWWVLEDCSQAHGATIEGRPVGSFGCAGGFSAYPTKNLGAWGDAGFVTGSDPHLEGEIRALRHHAQREPNAHDAIAGTHRLDSIQALVLLEKLKRLPQEVECRRAIAAWYREALADLPVSPPDDMGSRRHAYHQFVIRVPQREGIRDRLHERGVGTGIHYPTPVHLQPGASDMCDVPMKPRNAERLCGQILSLPMYPQITQNQVHQVASALSEVLA